MCTSAAVPRSRRTPTSSGHRHQLTQEHPRSPPAGPRPSRRSSAGSPHEIARRTGLDVDRDPYPALVVTAAIGALKVGVSVWQERGRTESAGEVIDEAFRHVEDGMALPRTVATAPA